MSKELIVSIGEDILSKFGIPSSSLQTLFNKLLNKKAEDAQNIIIDEIRDGDFNGIGDDDKISILYRFMQAAINGTAKINLRLLAKMISGLLNGEKLEEGLYSDKFNRYAQMLETLSYEEIQTLACLYKHRMMKDKEIEDKDSQEDTNMTGYKIYQKARKELETNNILEYTAFEATINALMRTGLIFGAGLGMTTNAYYELSPSFYRIIELVDFEDAINKESN